MFVTKQISGPIDYHSIFFLPTMEVKGAHQLFGYPYSVYILWFAE